MMLIVQFKYDIDHILICLLIYANSVLPAADDPLYHNPPSPNPEYEFDNVVPSSAGYS